MHDIPAAINYIFTLTKVRLFYIGHSMGCSTFSVMASTKPEVAKNIRAMFALAPAVYERNIKHPIFQRIAPLWKELKVSIGILINNQFLI